MIDDKNKEKINILLKRNNTNNAKNLNVISKNIIQKENDIPSKIYNKTNQNESSSGYLSISQRILDTSISKNKKQRKENKNERLLFSPIACKTSIGFGLKKISIKLNNSPKQNMRLQRKIYENKQYENHVINTNPEEETNENIININTNQKANDNIIKNKENSDYNTFNNLLLSKNKKKLNMKLRRNKKEILNKSANNSKNKIKSNILNTSKNKINKEEYDFIIPKKYTNKEYKLIKSQKEGDKIINIYSNDKKEIIYNNGMKKEIYKNEHQIIYYPNGDIKQIFSNGKISYLYKDSKIVQTTLNNGIKVYKLNDGQIEKHFPDGTKLIIFNDDTEKYIYNDGSEETYFSEGFVKKNKDVILEKTLEEDN